MRAKHANHTDANAPCTWGIDGETGQLVQQATDGVWEPLSVKLQTYKTAIETAILLLRIDDIVSGSKKKGDKNEIPKPSEAAAQQQDQD